jgi:hypothetical protein
VFLGKNAAGQICLYDTTLDGMESGGGCNAGDDFFAGRSFFVSLSYSGGPTVQSVTAARLVGVATEDVERLMVIDSAGRATRVSLTADRGFAYVVPPARLKSGIEPREVIAYDGGGQELDRQATGISP